MALFEWIVCAASLQPLGYTMDAEPQGDPPAAIRRASFEDASTRSTSSAPRPVGATSRPSQSAPPVERPAYSGRASINAAVLFGGAAWGTSIATAALVRPGCGNCDRASMVSLFGVRWAANGAALGLAIAGGHHRGRDHAARARRGDAPVRDPSRFIYAGGATLAIGSALWLATRAWATVESFERRGWQPAMNAGYFISLQAGWTAASVGAALLSYGLSLDKAGRARAVLDAGRAALGAQRRRALADRTVLSRSPRRTLPVPVARIVTESTPCLGKSGC